VIGDVGLVEPDIEACAREGVVEEFGAREIGTTVTEEEVVRGHRVLLCMEGGSATP
jgi:hypothetical protein